MRRGTCHSVGGSVARSVATALAALVAAGSAAAAPVVEEHFEFDDASGSFTVGDPPFTVTFVGGNAQDIGRPEMVYDGTRAWMVPGGGEGFITFSVPAEQIRMQARGDVGLPTLVIVRRAGGGTNATALARTHFFELVDPIFLPLGPVVGVEVSPSDVPGKWAAIDAFVYRASCAAALGQAVDGLRPLGDAVLCLAGYAKP